MSLGSDLHLATRDSSASTAERVPRQLLGWGKRCSTRGLVAETEGKQELPKPASPLANIPADGDEQLCTRGCSPPSTQTGPQSGAGMFTAMQVFGEGCRQGKWAHSGINHNIYYICRGNGCDTRPREAPCTLQGDGALGTWNSYSRAAAPREVRSRGDISQDTHRGGLLPSPLSHPAEDTWAGESHCEIQTRGEFQLLKKSCKAGGGTDDAASCWESLASRNAAGRRETPLSNAN